MRGEPCKTRIVLFSRDGAQARALADAIAETPFANVSLFRVDSKTAAMKTRWRLLPRIGHWQLARGTTTAGRLVQRDYSSRGIAAATVPTVLRARNNFQILPLLQL